MKALPIAVLLLASGSALANDGALLKCRAIADVTARVACYDAIPVGQAHAAAVAAQPAAAPAASARTAEANFGMEAAKKREAEPKRIQSTIVGDFDGWGANTRIKLANGQVWRVIDNSEAVLPRRADTPVTIERNVFGSLFLRVDGTNSSARVRRVE